MDENNKKSKTKKRIFTSIFVLFNIIILFWIALSEFGGSRDQVDFSSIQLHGWMLVPAVLIFIIGIGSECYKYTIMSQKLGKQKNWRIGTRTVLLGRYYDNITPAAVGGQPFQIHYMHTHGVKDGYDAIIPVVGLITTQMGFLIVAIITFLFFGSRIDPIVLGTGMLGLIFYAVFPIAVLWATFRPRSLSKLISWGVSLLAKIHIIKNKEEAADRAERALSNYVHCVKTILKDKKLSFIIIAFSVLFHVCITVLPYFILRAFGGDINFFTCFATVLAITSSVYIVPTPGNAGAAESVFFIVFKSLTSGYIFWAVLFWRFFTYYIYIIMGIVVYAFIAYQKKTGREFLDDVWLGTKALINKIVNRK